ncbi:transposase [Virgibacillus xinjiangensis]|uniref:Transposase n=1 Tax=Virgibacillus xinjiangensis TaxID=393090 RepID=A0ABV7CVR0_9BACI
MGKLRKYSYDDKVQVVKKFMEGYPSSRLVKEFNIKHRNRIYEWRDQVLQGGYEALKGHRGMTNKAPHQNRERSLEEENEHLKLEVKYLKKLLELQRR